MRPYPLRLSCPRSLTGVGEDGVHPPYDMLEPLDAALMFGNGDVVEYIRRHELVEYIQIIVVALL